MPRVKAMSHVATLCPCPKKESVKHEAGLTGDLLTYLGVSKNQGPTLVKRTTTRSTPNLQKQHMIISTRSLINPQIPLKEPCNSLVKHPNLQKQPYGSYEDHFQTCPISTPKLPSKEPYNSIEKEPPIYKNSASSPKAVDI